LGDGNYIHKKIEKAAVFIDGGYLSRILKKYFNKPEIDYLKLCNLICEKIQVRRLRTYFYHCKPIVRKGNKEDEKKDNSMQKFLTKLKRLPRFEVSLGRLQYINGVFKQKMVDVLMSLDIVDMCFENQIQHAILIAGDSDFVPAIKRAKDDGAIIHLFYHPESIHTEMLDIVDELHPITEELIENCKISNQNT